MMRQGRSLEVREMISFPAQRGASPVTDSAPEFVPLTATDGITFADTKFVPSGEANAIRVSFVPEGSNPTDAPE
jgi:hypothetical protein